MTSTIVVDLDGTLTYTDTLVESCLKLCKKNPVNLFKLPFWLMEGRAQFKAKIGSQVDISAETLPYNHDLIEYLRSEKSKGRPIILATAANETIAHAVAAHLDLFDQVLASNDKQNLKGKNKLATIDKAIGHNFVYAGDSHADIPIWQASQAGILVNTSKRVSNVVSKIITIEKDFPATTVDFPLWLKAFRVHQWLKNLLIFVPLLTAFSFQDTDKLIASFYAFFAFSLTASATYIGNDLWDLDSDRNHPRKKNRPFASAKIPIISGIAASLLLLMMGLLLAHYVSLELLEMLLLYLITTIFYTLALKAYVLIDVIVLSLLYTLRIIAGSVAATVAISNWLLAFSVFIFFSLALVKRCSELVCLQEKGQANTHGRDYRTNDLLVLWPLGIGSALSAVVVFGLFISSPDTQIRYAWPQGLWIVAVCLIYWMARIWIKTSRGEMHDDPLVFAMSDFGSRITILGMMTVMIISHFAPWR